MGGCSLISDFDDYSFADRDALVNEAGSGSTWTGIGGTGESGGSGGSVDPDSGPLVNPDGGDIEQLDAGEQVADAGKTADSGLDAGLEGASDAGQDASQDSGLEADSGSNEGQDAAVGCPLQSGGCTFRSTAGRYKYSDNCLATMILDDQTCLVWWGYTLGNWQEAVNWCELADNSVYQDWRLPSAEELLTIVDSPLNGTLWSSTEDGASAIIVDVDKDIDSFKPKSDIYGFICVRTM
jgi:hypothetical protein